MNLIIDKIENNVSSRHWKQQGLRERLVKSVEAIESLHTWRSGPETRRPITIRQCHEWFERKVKDTRIAVDRLKPVAENFEPEVLHRSDNEQPELTVDDKTDESTTTEIQQPEKPKIHLNN